MGEQLKTHLPGINIEVDYLSEAPTSVVVYYEGSGQPARHDINRYDMNYMIWVESTDWGLAEYLANQIFDYFHEYHKRERPLIAVNYVNEQMEILATESVKLHTMFASSHINPLGVDDGRMQFTVNMQAIITKEETPNE